MKGSYHQIANFVSDLAQMSRIVTVGDLTMTGEDNGEVKATLILQTYSYLPRVSNVSRARGVQAIHPYGISGVYAGGPGGCSEQRTLDDLDRYVTTLHRDAVPKVDPIPEQPR